MCPHENHAANCPNLSLYSSRQVAKCKASPYNSRPHTQGTMLTDRAIRRAKIGADSRKRRYDQFGTQRTSPKASENEIMLFRGSQSVMSSKPEA